MRREEKEYIDLKFTGINAKMDSNMTILDLVHQEIKKQNGRLFRIEQHIMMRLGWLAIPIIAGIAIIAIIILDQSGIIELVRFLK